MTKMSNRVVLDSLLITEIRTKPSDTPDTLILQSEDVTSPVKTNELGSEGLWDLAHAQYAGHRVTMVLEFDCECGDDE